MNNIADREKAVNCGKRLCGDFGVDFCKDGEQFVIVENVMEHARGKNPIVVWSVYCGMLEQRGRRALGNWCGRHGRNRHTGEAEHEEG